MLKQFATNKVYALLLVLVIGGFAWAGLSGTWLLGDDLESVEKADGRRGSGFHRSHAGGYRGRSGFYHK